MSVLPKDDLMFVDQEHHSSLHSIYGPSWRSRQKASKVEGLIRQRELKETGWIDDA